MTSYSASPQMDGKVDETATPVSDERKSNILAEEEKTERLKSLKSKQTVSLSWLTRKINEINELMCYSENLHLVKRCQVEFDDLHAKYSLCFMNYYEIVESVEDRDHVNKRHTEKEESLAKFRNRLTKWIDHHENQMADRLESASQHHSHTSTKSSSSRASTRSFRAVHAKEKAKLAELLAEKSMMNKVLKLQEIQLDIEIEKAKAREKVYSEVENVYDTKQKVGFPALVSAPSFTCEIETEAATYPSQPRVFSTEPEVQFSVGNHALTEHLDDYRQPQTSTVRPDQHIAAHDCLRQDSSPLDPRAHTFTPGEQLNLQGVNDVSVIESTLALQQKQNELILQTHRQMATALFLPQLEIQKFKGSYTDFGPFMMSFDTRIVPHASSDTDRLYYLDQHLVGEPKDLIAGCLYMDPVTGYRTAKELLQSEYGDPYKVSTAYVNQVLAWPNIKYDDSHALKQLSFLLIRCRNAMKSMTHMEVLNHAPNLQAIIQKLPTHLQSKWRDHVTKLRSQSRSIVFKDLVDFIDFAAKSANEPVFGKQAMSKLDPHSQSSKTWRKMSSPKPRFKETSTFATSTNSSLSAVHNVPKRLVCYFCGQSHDIDECPAFNRKALSERREFLKERHMCFGCYGSNHLSKGCLRKRSCKKCGRKHPTALHDPSFKSSSDLQSSKSAEVNLTTVEQDSIQQSSQATCHSTKSDVKESVLQPILPVTVRQKGGQRLVHTYAFLDNGSTGCFISDSLKNQLDATGEDTTLRLQTMHGVTMVATCAVSDLIVSDLNDSNQVLLPRTFTRDSIPVSHDQIPKSEVLKQWSHLIDVAERLPQYHPEFDVGLLIGSNCPAAIQPLCVVPAGGDGPFAVQYLHGWTISGPLHLTVDKDKQGISCNQILLQEPVHIKEGVTSQSVLNLFQLDFPEHACKRPGELGHSVEDKQFLKLAKDELELSDDNHYVLPLPFKQDDELDNDPKRVWYLPHHGIYHPKKPNKIRVVFDCSAKYKGVSLNDRLLQGPDLTNSLIGVLTRFRKENIAFIGDIEAMFYQVRVPPHQHDFLRFLWWPDGDLNADMQEFRMSVHIFGAVSSPSISNYALKATADRAENKYGSFVADTIRKNFYVDDCLKSVQDTDTSIAVIRDLCKACSDGGFRLTKFCCNDKSVLKALPPEDHSNELQSIDLDRDDLPVERALGMKWNIESDVFGFSSDLSPKPVTRRGILSTVSSLYDPLGGVAPVTMPAKKILQELCKEENLDWDDGIPIEHERKWNKWLQELPLLKNVNFRRCIKPTEFGTLVSTQMHIFSDASTNGYGCCAYVRLQDHHGNVYTSFLLGKARVAPIKLMTVPKLELTAASVSVGIAQMLLQELEMDFDQVIYHTDSTTVLHYIRNERKRFPVFVANRVSTIRDFTKPDQWRYVPSKNNPADLASRGVSATQFLKSDQEMWFSGPQFLRRPETEWPTQPFLEQDEPLFNETASSTIATEATDSIDPTDTLLNHFSDLHRLKTAVAVYRRMFCVLKSRVLGKELPVVSHPFTVNELTEAELAVLGYVQRGAFGTEIKLLCSQDKRGRGHGVPKTNPLRKLDPILKNGLLCVGGRLSHAKIPDEMKHQIIMPRQNPVTSLIVRQIHHKTGHGGRNHIMSSLRERYWIVKASSVVRSEIAKCVTCRRFRAPSCDQKMADLPFYRVNPAPPFTYSGVDFFGPHIIKDGRKQVKRYGALFTCLVSRAVHIESANSLETDTFIQVLQRFMARRGPVRELHSDNGTNFTGAARELKQSLSDLDQQKIQSFLLENQIDWKFNPPSASHMGGVWERMIRTVRKVLNPLLYEFGERLNDEAYRTLLCEVEAIVNSRPLTTVSSDPDDLNPLTPNHLLMVKSNVILPPLGQFQRGDMYMRRRWRQIQYLSNVFWSRWRKEYLLALQERQKWATPKRNMSVGDVVLIKDENLDRCLWSLGRVIETYVGKGGLVRTVKLKTQTSELVRPVHKLVVLLECGLEID